MITTFCSETDPGAFSFMYNGEWHKRSYLRTFGVGATVATWERNRHDDSDFYATYWTGTGFQTVMYGTTRFWSYPACASVDADETLMAAYREHLKRGERNQRAVSLRIALRYRRASVKSSAITFADFQKLASIYKSSPDLFSAILRLLKTRKFRSQLRASISSQIRSWLSDPDPRYVTPISPRQAALLSGTSY